MMESEAADSGTSSTTNPRRELSEDIQKCTRRNFLKGAGIGAAGLAAAGMFGCAPSAPATSGSSDNAAGTAGSSAPASSWRTAPEPIAEDSIAETADCDVLVIGLEL